MLDANGEQSGGVTLPTGGLINSATDAVVAMIRGTGMVIDTKTMALFGATQREINSAVGMMGGTWVSATTKVNNSVIDMKNFTTPVVTDMQRSITGSISGMGTQSTGLASGMSSGVVASMQQMAAGAAQAASAIAASAAACAASAGAAAASGGGGGGGGSGMFGNSTSIPLPNGGSINSNTQSNFTPAVYNQNLVLNNAQIGNSASLQAMIDSYRKVTLGAKTRAGF
jgi:hypothetical protein